MTCRGAEAALVEPPAIRTTTHSPEATAALAGRLARLLQGGETLALTGGLGAGKTCFTQGLAEGLGVAEPVASPTFLIHRSYQGRLRLHHFDFYRLADEWDLESIGFYDFQAEQACSATVVEWADRFPGALDMPLLRIAIRPGLCATDREIEIQGLGVGAAQWEEIVRIMENG